MKTAPRPIAYVLASSDHGTLIVNRLDYRQDGARTVGVGHQILSASAYDPNEVSLIVNMLGERRKLFGDGVVAIDCGANIGVHTVEWARLMAGWGTVIAIEAQERIFYALAGNIAINNCFNARALWAAVGATVGSIKVPVPNYFAPGSFGSLELKPSDRNEFIGQKIDYAAGVDTRMLTIDSLDLARLDLIKIDIEGMEVEALEGAARTVRRHKPQLVIEKIKSDEGALRAFLDREGYRIFPFGMDIVAIHDSDQTHKKFVPA